MDNESEANEVTRNPEGEEVVAETINAYRVQKLKNGSIRIQSGGHVSGGETYYKALRSYAEWQQQELEDSPEHLRTDKWKSIYDGVIPLRSFGSDGFTPEEILDEVTGQPLSTVLEDLVVNSDHGELCSCYECEGGEGGERLDGICPECDGEAAVYRSPKDPSEGHVYCLEDDCGWIHRHLSSVGRYVEDDNGA